VALIKKINFTAWTAAFGDVISFSPACSSSALFRNQKKTGVVRSRRPKMLADAMGGGSVNCHHNRKAGQNIPARSFLMTTKNFSDLRRVFLRKNPGATQPKPDLKRKDAVRRH